MLVACLLICCVWFFAALLPVYAASPAVPQKTHKAPPKRAARSGWDFQAPDRSAQHARWRESISATLQQTTFAPSAPAGRYLQNNAPASAKRLPPAQIGDLDKMRPPENKQLMLGDKTAVHGEFVRERTAWRPHNESSDAIDVGPALKEERRAGAYASFHPSEDVEFKFGPEYSLGTAVSRPEQTGYSKDHPGALGMGMRLKVDF